MKDTVEVRLQVPRAIHEKIQAAAQWEMRTTHNQYIHYLMWLHKDSTPYPEIAKTWPDPKDKP